MSAPQRPRRTRSGYRFQFSTTAHLGGERIAEPVGRGEGATRSCSAGRRRRPGRSGIPPAHAGRHERSITPTTMLPMVVTDRRGRFGRYGRSHGRIDGVHRTRVSRRSPTTSASTAHVSPRSPRPTSAPTETTSSGRSTRPNDRSASPNVGCSEISSCSAHTSTHRCRPTPATPPPRRNSARSSRSNPGCVPSSHASPTGLVRSTSPISSRSATRRPSTSDRSAGWQNGQTTRCRRWKSTSTPSCRPPVPVPGAGSSGR